MHQSGCLAQDLQSIIFVTLANAYWPLDSRRRRRRRRKWRFELHETTWDYVLYQLSVLHSSRIHTSAFICMCLTRMCVFNIEVNTTIICILVYSLAVRGILCDNIMMIIIFRKLAVYDIYRLLATSAQCTNTLCTPLHNSACIHRMCRVFRPWTSASTTHSSGTVLIR